jgi:hypothetical protein
VFGVSVHRLEAPLRFLLRVRFNGLLFLFFTS